MCRLLRMTGTHGDATCKRMAPYTCAPNRLNPGRTVLSLMRMDPVILDELGYLLLSQAGGALVVSPAVQAVRRTPARSKFNRRQHIMRFSA